MCRNHFSYRKICFQRVAAPLRLQIIKDKHFSYGLCKKCPKNLEGALGVFLYFRKWIYILKKLVTCISKLFYSFPIYLKLEVKIIFFIHINSTSVQTVLCNITRVRDMFSELTPKRTVCKLFSLFSLIKEILCIVKEKNTSHFYS